MAATPVMQLPVISECAAEGCAYNHDHTCHAAAITVGDLDSPVCDTFMGADLEGGEPSTTGRVGACKMADCLGTTADSNATPRRSPSATSTSRWTASRTRRSDRRTAGHGRRVSGVPP